MLYKKISFAFNKYWRHIFYLLLSKWYHFLAKNITVTTIDESIHQILNNQLSVSRYGDGELRLMCGESIEFQTYSKALQDGLIDVIKSNKSGHMVCLPDIFTSLHQYKNQASYFWEFHLYKYFTSWMKFAVSKKLYGNAFITRPYVTYKSYQQSAGWFELLQKIWNQKEVVIIEGFSSRLGVGNDLFNNCKSIERIICPSLNAFLNYREIVDKALMLPKSKLVLIALGPTATVLAYDLYKAGYQAIDIGHVDIEYEWFLMKADWKVNIAHKHTNEASNSLPENTIADDSYLSQIIASIK